MPSVPTGHGGVLGALLLGQQVVVAEWVPGKRVQSLQTLFVRSGSAELPMRVDVEQLQSGRSFAFVTLTFRQGDVLVSRASVPLTADEPDVLRAVASAPPRGAPGTPVHRTLMPWLARALPSPDPLTVDLLLRVPEVDGEPRTARALLAYLSELPALQQAVDGLGVPADQGRLPGAVLSQTVTFLEPLDVREEFRVRVVVPYVGAGRVLGRGEVFRPDTQLVATFATSGLLRRPPS